MKMERRHSEGESSKEGVAARGEQDGYDDETREKEEDIKNGELFSSSSALLTALPRRGREQQLKNPFLEDDHSCTPTGEEEKKESERDSTERSHHHHRSYQHRKEGEAGEDRKVCESQDRQLKLEKEGRDDDLSHNETKKRRSEARNELCPSPPSSWCICRYLRHVKVPSVAPVTPQQQRKWNEVWPCYLNKTKPPPSGSMKGGGEERDDDRPTGESSVENALSTTLPEGVKTRERSRGDATEIERLRDAGERQEKEKISPAQRKTTGEEEEVSKKEVRRHGTSRGREEEERGRLKEKEEERDKDSPSPVESSGMRQELLIPLQLTPEEKEQHKLYLQAAVRCT